MSSADPSADDAQSGGGGGDSPAPKAIANNRTESIQVGIRCRPLIGRDAGQSRAWETYKTSLQPNDQAPAGKMGGNDKGAWSFDSAF